MAAIGVRKESIQGYKTGRKTGLIFRAYNQAGALVDSNEQVPVADRSTTMLGKANPTPKSLLGLVGQQGQLAANTRENNTGV